MKPSILSVLAVALAVATTLYAAVIDFSGTFDTTWDSGSQATRLVMAQKGDAVTGKYTYQKGQIKGTVSGNTATGTWWQADDGATGTFMFVLSSDGQSFRGKWRNGSSGAWVGEWNGVRQ